MSDLDRIEADAELENGARAAVRSMVLKAMAAEVHLDILADWIAEDLQENGLVDVYVEIGA